MEKEEDMNGCHTEYPSCEDVCKKYNNKFEGILALAREADRLFEILGEKPSKLVQKAIDNLLFKKGKEEISQQDSTLGTDTLVQNKDALFSTHTEDKKDATVEKPSKPLDSIKKPEKNITGN